MSRTLDLLLLMLVVGLAWWLFGRGEPTRASSPPPAAIRDAAPVRAAPPTGVVGPELPAPPTPAGPCTLTWSVDDPALLAHPALVFVVAAAGSTRLAAVAVDVDPGGTRASASLPARPSALGLALALPELEVVAWVPLADAALAADSTEAPAPQWTLSESPLRLADRLQRVSLDVVDAEGARVDDATLHWPNARRAGPLSADSIELPLDLHGKALLPRRPGNTVLVRSSRGEARVAEPMDGMRVVLDVPR